MELRQVGRREASTNVREKFLQKWKFSLTKLLSLNWQRLVRYDWIFFFGWTVPSNQAPQNKKQIRQPKLTLITVSVEVKLAKTHHLRVVCQEEEWKIPFIDQCRSECQFAAVCHLIYRPSGTGGGSNYASTCTLNKAFKAKDLNTGMRNNQQQTRIQVKYINHPFWHWQTKKGLMIVHCHIAGVYWMNLMKKGDC